MSFFINTIQASKELVPCWIEDEALPFLIRTSHRKNAFASGIIDRSKAMVPGTIAAQYNEKELPNGNVHYNKRIF